MSMGNPCGGWAGSSRWGWLAESRGRDARSDGAGPYACPAHLVPAMVGNACAERHADRRRGSAAHAGSLGGMSRRRRKIWSWIWLGSGLLALVAGIGWHRAREIARREELSLAREAIDAGHYGRARERLARLAESLDATTAKSTCSWASANCDAARREAALAAWEKVAPTDRSFAQAARFRASSLIDMGKYSLAEELLLRASANPGPDGPYELERELIRLYRSEGRFGDVRRILRASWCRSPDAARRAEGTLERSIIRRSRSRPGDSRSITPTTTMTGSGSGGPIMRCSPASSAPPPIGSGLPGAAAG